MDCSEIQRRLWAGEPVGVGKHLEDCGDCRLELVRSRQLTVALADLRHDLATAPGGLEAAILDLVEPSRLRRAREVLARPRVLRGAAVGAAAAAATAAVGMIVARRLARPDLVA